MTDPHAPAHSLPPVDMSVPARSQVGRWQQVLTLLWLAVAVGLAGWGASRPDGSVAWGLLPLLWLPAVLALQFGLAYGINSAQGLAPLSVSGMARAWWGEWRMSSAVFGWHQPWRWRRFANGVLPVEGLGEAVPAGALPARGVLLVHGFMCNRGLWNSWRPALAGAGHPVLALNLEPMFASIDDYAPLIEDAVSRLTQATGRPPVVVAHSMGGLAVRAWLRAHPGAAERVAHVVTIGTPHHGTWLARWGHGANARQMRWHSPWLRALAASEADRPAVPMTCWHSCGDNIVFPLGTAVWPGADARPLPHVGHVALLAHPDVLAHTLRLLRT